MALMMEFSTTCKPEERPNTSVEGGTLKVQSYFVFVRLICIKKRVCIIKCLTYLVLLKI